jgi:hypothetical protein
LSKKMWGLRRFTTLWASMACYRDNFTSFLPFIQWQYAFSEIYALIILSPRCARVLGLRRVSPLPSLDKDVQIWKETVLAYYKIVLPAFVWRYFRKPRHTSLRISGKIAGNQTGTSRIEV